MSSIREALEQGVRALPNTSRVKADTAYASSTYLVSGFSRTGPRVNRNEEQRGSEV